MTLRQIKIYPYDKILRKKSKPIKKITPSILRLLDDMIETIRQSRGAGLSAPQVGVLKRVIVIEIEPGNPFKFINPKIIEKSGEQINPEGCLSVPDLVGEVKRAQRVVIKAKDIKGKTIKIEALDLLARVFQHEIDHLDGILYIDKAENLRKVLPPEEIVDI